MANYYTGDISAIELPDPMPMTIAMKVADQFEAKVPDWTAAKRYTVQVGPIGLTIGLRTGTIRWTPTPNQVGTHPVLIDDGVGGTLTCSIAVATNPAFTADLSGFGWVANVGSGTGTLAAPSIDLRAFRGTKVGATYNSTKPIVYLRGGCYPKGTENRKMTAVEKAVRDIDLNGVEIRAWGNERVTLRIGENPVRISDGCSSVTVDGLELRGDSDRYGYTEAIAGWWDSPAHLNSNGFAIGGTGITIKNCVVHEVMGQGISFKQATDSIAQNNIVANSARWTVAGTTAIGMVSSTPSAKPVTEQAMKMVGNLLFGVESRLYSHVFSKGFSTLSIDEGSAILAQPIAVTTSNEATGYRGRFLIQNNLAMFCGKGIVVNTAANCDVWNNSIFKTGTTINADSKGLRGNKASNSTWKNNLVSMIAGSGGDPGSAYSFGHGDTTSGYVYPAFENNWGEVDDGKESGLTLIPQVYANPNDLDPTPHPSVATGVGADVAHHKALIEKARSYSVNLTPDPYWQTMDYAEMTKDVLNRLPAGLTADYSNWQNTLPYTDAQGVKHAEFDLPITGNLAANGLPSPFKLIVTQPFARN